MQRLETVEDFERVGKALSNSGSKLSEYCVVAFGYCNFCKLVSEFEHIILGPNHIHCLGCGNKFYPDYMGLSYLYCPDDATVFEFKVGSDFMLEQQLRSGRQFFSRHYQRRLFNEKLEIRITELKKKNRVHARQIRQLAKLRSQHT